MIGCADLYIAFFEAALKQLKLEGICAFICADRWMLKMLNQYGAELRRMITASFDVQTVVEMHNAALGLEVSAYPAVTIIRQCCVKPGREECMVSIPPNRTGALVIDANVMIAICAKEAIKEISAPDRLCD